MLGAVAVAVAVAVAAAAMVMDTVPRAVTLPLTLSVVWQPIVNAGSAAACG